MPEPSASVEPLRDAFLLRIHPSGGGLGDAWSWSCVVERDPDHPDVAIIKVAPRAVTRAEREAIQRALAPLGFAGARWERIRNDRVHRTKILRPRA